jgi:hypothetical protein
MLELTDGLKALLKETAERLKGHERRRFMAQTVEELGRGGQRLAPKRTGLAPRPNSERKTRSREWNRLCGRI